MTTGESIALKIQFDLTVELLPSLRDWNCQLVKVVKMVQFEEWAKPIRLNALWKQYDAMVELPNCLCAAASDFKKHNQLLKLMQFLMGLDDSYMSIRSLFSLGDFSDMKIAIQSFLHSGSTSGGFTDEQLATLLSLFKDKGPERNVQANMADENKCLLLNQDLDLKNVLGTGRQCGGLYYLDTQGTKCKIDHNVLTVPVLYDWHLSTGHPG
ncbi:hypothetical protein Tco_0223881 [Tanacetum coccineum]